MEYDAFLETIKTNCPVMLWTMAGIAFLVLQAVEFLNIVRDRGSMETAIRIIREKRVRFFGWPVLFVWVLQGLPCTILVYGAVFIFIWSKAYFSSMCRTLYAVCFRPQGDVYVLRQYLYYRWDHEKFDEKLRQQGIKYEYEQTEDKYIERIFHSYGDYRAACCMVNKIDRNLYVPVNGCIVEGSISAL